MRRREVIALSGSAALATPLAARAQQQAHPARIGILTPAGNPKSALFMAFSERMRELGYVEGRTLVTEFRSAGGDLNRLNDLAMELVRFPVDVIITDGIQSAQAAKRATSTIPIVMATSGDAVAAGLVDSLARPGGNITGFTLDPPSLGAKRVELLREILPTVSSVGVLWDPANPSHHPQFAATEQAARALGVGLETAEARNIGEIPVALDKLARSGVRALIVFGGALFWNQRSVIVERVAALSLPAFYPEREYVEAGGLVAYGPNVSENFRAAAVYVARVLKGSKLAELPVQNPTTFELVINLKTAKALGLTIPPSILARADEVIE